MGLKELSVELRSGSTKNVGELDGAVHCPICGERTLIAIGVKYLCRGRCHRIIETFPDGDGPV